MTAMDHPALMLTVLPAAGYLIGSTPFGAILARLHGVDLRRAGSGNVGATNVGRVLGRKWGVLCFLLDVAKGLGPVLAARWLIHAPGELPSPLQQTAWLAVGCACILGHVFSFYLKFRGGKGVATSLGVVLGVYPYFTIPGIAAFAVWVAVTFLSRYVSLGSIVAALAFLPFFAVMNGPDLRHLWPLGAFAALMTALILWRHRGNVARLLAGTENRIGGPAGPAGHQARPDAADASPSQIGDDQADS